jgi:hypothetical protein
MSAWNGILQALHSSLIDELNARFPDEKLELGLPARFEGWGAPAARGETFLFQGVSSTEGEGITAFGTLNAQSSGETREIWDSVLKRAIREFSIRKIDAKFTDRLPSPPKLRMTIWLPIRIPGLKMNPVYDLAVGV